MPAMPPLALIAALRRMLDRRACRRELAAFLTVDDRQLADIGLSRVRIRKALRHAGRDNPCRWCAVGRAGSGPGDPRHLC